MIVRFAFGLDGRCDDDDDDLTFDTYTHMHKCRSQDRDVDASASNAVLLVSLIVSSRIFSSLTLSLFLSTVVSLPVVGHLFPLLLCKTTNSNNNNNKYTNSRTNIYFTFIAVKIYHIIMVHVRII